MGVHFPTVELDIAIWFSTLSRMPRFLWHGSRWARWLDHFLQYNTPRLYVLACNLDTDLNYVTAMLQLCLSLNHRGVFSWTDTIVCIGVSTPPPKKTPPPSILPSPPFQAIHPSILAFRESPLKIRPYSEPPKY